MHTRTIVAGVVCLVLVTAAQARPIEDWSYQRLLEASDVVVIGTMVSTQGSDKPLALPLFADALEGQLTTFKVEIVFKGKLVGDKINLLHCRIKEGVSVENGPLLAEFRKKGRVLEIVKVDGVKEMRSEQEGTPNYLLFLKARSDGFFEPVAGQVDSELSVRSMSLGH